jgi:serine/threonine protein kinase
MAVAEEASRRRVGPWELRGRLGEGGDAKVYRAIRDCGEGEVALKLVNATNAQREPYQRFVREIAVLRWIGGVPGVLPVTDAYLPDHPSGDDRPWLVMPIARSLAVALAGEPLERTVEAMATVADTLSHLAAEHGIAHRDIKPGNLYELDGRFVIGDFGLVALPDVEELTRSGRPLGPAHYLPFEMLRDPGSADPHKADVYMLAKTLWVLACGQNFPPQGHQPAAGPLSTIAEMRPHRHAPALDRLVDRMTRARPEERPGMTEVATELRGWLELPQRALTLDVSSARERLRSKLRRELDQQNLQQQRQDLAAEAARQLQDLFRPFDDALRDLHPAARCNHMGDQSTQGLLKTLSAFGAPTIVWRWARWSRVQAGPDHDPYTLRVGRGLELQEDGGLVLHLWIDVGGPYLGGTDFSWQPEPRVAPVGTVAADNMLTDGLAELADQLHRRSTSSSRTHRQREREAVRRACRR